MGAKKTIGFPVWKRWSHLCMCQILVLVDPWPSHIVALHHFVWWFAENINTSLSFSILILFIYDLLLIFFVSRIRGFGPCCVFYTLHSKYTLMADEDAIASKSLPNRAILISIKILVLKEKITQRNENFLLLSCKTN